MDMGVLDKLKQRVESFLSLMRKKLSFRNAIGLSLLLHISVGVAAASVFLGRHFINPESEELIELELVADEEIEQLPELINPGVISPIGLNSSRNSAADLAKKTTESSAPEGLNELDEEIERSAVLFASLESLSELRESFSFLEVEWSSDFVTAVAPIQGAAPDVSTLAAGLNGNANGRGGRGRGIRVGIGGGGGDCPPR